MSNSNIKAQVFLSQLNIKATPEMVELVKKQFEQVPERLNMNQLNATENGNLVME